MKLSVLKIRDFRTSMLTRMFVMMSWIAQDVIIGWQIYSITKDPFMLGLVGLVEAVPALVCALFAGHIVDISRPYRVLLICIGVMVLNSYNLMWIAGGHAGATNIVPWLFFGVFVSGVARSFIMPASFTMLPQIVPKAQIPSASAFMTGSIQIATVAAPAIAGLVYGGYGASIAWYIPNILITMAFLLYLFGMSERPRNWRSSEKREAAAKSIKAGWKFIFTNNVMLAIMALDMFAVIFGGALAMLPAYADQVLHVGSEGLGILRAAPAVGAIGIALFLAVKPFKTIKAKWLLWVITGFGICTIGIGLSNIFWVSLLFFILSGAFDSVSMVIRSTLMQWLTPDNMRGRVSSVNSMFIISSNQIGAFWQGSLAKMVGLVPSIIIGGIGSLVVVGATIVLSPKLKKLEVKP